MDFASALEKFEQTANAAQQGTNQTNQNSGNTSNTQSQSRGHGGGRGRLGGADYGHYSDPSYHRSGRGGQSEGGRGGGSHHSNNPRRRGYSDHQQHNHIENEYNRRNTRPRLGSGEGTSSSYHHSSGRGGPGFHPSESHSSHRGVGSSTSPPTHRRPRALDEMARCGYHIDAYEPPAELPADLGRRPFHICLLAIIIDEMPYEHIWRHWAESAFEESNCRVSLLVHAKYPHKVTSKFVRRHLITKPPRMGRGNSYADPEYLTHEPSWGSIQITRAMIDLLRIGYDLASPQDALLNDSDPRFASRRFFLQSNSEKNKNSFPMADKFLFISETCLPVKTLREYVDAFFGDIKLYFSSGGEETNDSDPSTGTDKQKNLLTKEDASGASELFNRRQITPWEISWVNARSRNTPGTPRNMYERDQFADVHRMVHGHYRWKADQWLCLCRLHTEAILKIDRHITNYYHQLWNCFKNVSASDEMYFPCCLAVLQILEHGRQSQHAPEQNSDDGKETESKHNEDSRVHHVALRPVCFTDWSSGMRNPATFTKGVVDLERVAKLARKQGSLVARKFALKRQMVDEEESPVTGAISQEEWTSVVQSCQSQESEEERQKQHQLTENESGEKEDPIPDTATAAENPDRSIDGDKETQTSVDPIANVPEIGPDTNSQNDSPP